MLFCCTLKVNHRPLITAHENCFESLIKVLDTNNAVVLFASILAIKVLVTANRLSFLSLFLLSFLLIALLQTRLITINHQTSAAQGAEKFFATPEAVDTLIKMFDRYMDDSQRRIQFETGRIFPVLASYKGLSLKLVSDHIKASFSSPHPSVVLCRRVQTDPRRKRWRQGSADALLLIFCHLADRRPQGVEDMGQQPFVFPFFCFLSSFCFLSRAGEQSKTRKKTDRC